MEMITPQEKQECINEIREILKKDGLRGAIEAVESMLAKATGPLKAWLIKVLHYLESIEKQIEADLQAPLFDEEEKRIAEELEREAEIAKLWRQLAMGAWGCADVTWTGVASNIVQTIRPDQNDQEGPAPR